MAKLNHDLCCQVNPPPIETTAPPIWPQIRPNKLGLFASTAALQGHRETMEDYHRVVWGTGESERGFFGVYDGHNGKLAAAYAAANLHQIEPSVSSPALDETDMKTLLLPHSMRSSVPTLDSFQKQIASAYATIEAEMKARRSKEAIRAWSADPQIKPITSGTTATTVWIVGNTLYCANVGDSRAILYDGQCRVLTSDHRPKEPSERLRIANAGCKVSQEYVTRYLICCCFPRRVPEGALRMWSGDGKKGGLSVSRSLGDFYDKDLCPALTAVPHQFKMTISKEAKFLVIASDGLWDSISNDKVCTFILEAMANPTVDPANIASQLAHYVFQAGHSTDNITVCIVFFTHHENCAPMARPPKT